MIKFDYKKLTKEYADLKMMREQASGKDVPFEKSQEIRKEQQKKYDHYKFMMNLAKVCDKNGIN